MAKIRTLAVGVALALSASCAEAPMPAPPPAPVEPPAIAAPAVAPAPSQPAQSLQVVAAARLPMLFEPNRGQAAADVRFVARGPGQAVFLGDRTAAFAVALPPTDARARGVPSRPAETEFFVLRVEFAGARSAVRLAGRVPQTMAIHHAVGRDKARWHTDLPAYNEVRYEGLYPGIDAVFRPGDPGLAYDFVVAPGADPRAIRLRFPGADSLAIEPNGDLTIRVAGRAIRQHAPRLFQEGRDGRTAVDGGYVLRGPHEVGVRVGAYDRRRALIVDPILDVSTVFGGGDREVPDFSGFAVSETGDVAVTGFSVSADFPALGGGSGVRRGFSDMFVARFAAGTLAPASMTLFGGSREDYGGGVAFAPDGRIYVVGDTNSPDMPVTADAPDTSLRGLYSGMVVRLNAAGVPDYVTYLGGGGGGTALRSVIVSGSQVYVGGETASTDFATSPLIAGLPPSARSAGNTDAFVARLRHDTGALDFARYFGGSGADTILALAIDASGQLHATGFTSSPDLPGAPPGNQFRGVNDAFILKLNVAATGPVYFRYLGGSLFDIAYGVSIDSGGAAHVAGSTSSADFPTLAPFQPRLSNFTGFYARLNGQGDIEQSSHVGGSADSSAFSAARQPQSGIVWIAGGTSAPPPAPPADNANAGGTDGFVASLDPAVPALRSWTFVGGNSYDTIYRVFPSADGSLIVAGRTSSPDFPATRSLRNGVVGSEDVFVARLAPRPAAQPDLRVLLRDSRDPVSPGDRFDLEVTVVNDGPGSASGVAVELTLPPGLTPILPLPTGWTLGGATMRYALGGLDANRASPPLTLPVQCAAAGTHTTSVRVVATEPDRDPANDRRDETTSCGAPNLLVTVEAVDFVTGQPPGRRLFHDGPVRFRLVARNIGQGPANGVALTSARPAGCTPLNPGDADELILPTLAAGAAASLTVSMRCPAGLHVNVARVAAANESPAEASDGNTASATVQVEVRPLLRIALDFAPNEMRVGQFVRFAPVIENIGTVAAEDVRVLISFVGEDRAVLSAMIDFPGSVCTATNFALPQVRIECRAGTLAPGEVRYVVRLDGDGRAPGSIRVNSAAEAQDGRAVGDIRGFVVRP